jgi:hypothetical protein
MPPVSIQTGENGSGQPRFLGFGRSKVSLDPEANTVTAQIYGVGLTTARYKKFFGIKIPTYLAVTEYELGYFDSGKGYIDDNTFLALVDDGSTKVICTQLIPWYDHQVFDDVTHLNPASGQQATGFASEPGGLCNDCEFLRYGFWGADIQYANGEITEKMGGWWVATDAPVKRNDLPFDGTAEYMGSAQGTLAKSIDGIWQQGRAQGGLEMDWDLKQRHGRLDIIDFGNPALGYKSFGGQMRAPGYVNFGGDIHGGGGAGIAAGSFVGPRPGTAPAGIMGNFNINAHNNNWRANGVFGGANTRYTPANGLIAVDR